MMAHVLLETGVDALFLANIPVERLPFVTIAMAVVALFLSRLGGGQNHRRVLVLLQSGGALGTLILWALLATDVVWVYYALYAWAGIATSLIVVRFWLLLGDLFTIGEGKRAFATIAMGGSGGALLGSGLSVLMAPAFGGAGLLVAAALAYGLSIMTALYGLPPSESTSTERTTSSSTSPRWSESLRSLVENPYAARVAMIVAVASMTLTLGDYLFKSVLTEEVDAASLATWLSRIYLGLNLLSIGVLAVGVTPVVRRLGVDRSLAVLPALIAGSAVGVLAGGALVATVLLKLADGMLRYSLHKTATELLYLPMSSALRSAVKSVIDLVGQSAAKALASLLILGLVATPDPRGAIALGVAVLGGVWVMLALRLRHAYLDVFRETLGQGVIETMLEHPELDLDSVGSLIRALSDPDESRAVAALHLLAERGQMDLIPSLILYHPSPRVVSEALDRFAEDHRTDIAHLLSHLVDHPDAVVRAATVRAAWAIEHDVATLHSYEDSTCVVVRVSAAIGLFHRGAIGEAALAEQLDASMAYQDSAPRRAIARSAQLQYDEVLRDVLVALMRDDDPDVADEAVRAIRKSNDRRFVPHLIEHLDRRIIREPVRRALIEIGDDALTQLEQRLVSPDTPHELRTHLPRTIARFEPERAVAVLLRSLDQVEDRLTHFKILKGLEGLLRSQSHPAGSGALGMNRRSLDLKALRMAFHRTLEEALRLLTLGRQISAAMEQDSRRATVGGKLLVDLLRDKTGLATGRLMLMLGILYPREDFRSIANGLASAQTTDRASAIELIETLLSRDVAISILDLVSGRFEAAGQAQASIDYAPLLEEVASLGSETLGAVALYHAAEVGVGLAAAEPRVDAEGRAHGVAAIRALIHRDKSSVAEGRA